MAKVKVLHGDDNDANDNACVYYLLLVSIFCKWSHEVFDLNSIPIFALTALKSPVSLN